jgi:hypothetical protein
MLRRTDAKYMGMQGQIHKITLSAGGAERVAHAVRRVRWGRYAAAV